MIRAAQAERALTMAFPRVFDAHKVIVGMAYLVAYALLDWISFIEPYAHLGITPWNPGTGLSFVLLLLFGQRMFPFLLVSPLLADLVHQQFALPWTFEILSSVLSRRGLFARLDVSAAPES